jgi:CheY-like chemotaxis protein
MNDKEIIRVLVVEDNQIAQRIARMVIESLNCEFDIIDTGFQALQLFVENRYDLVFVDLGLPDMDGFDVTTKMREIEKKLSLMPIPIVGLSVHTRDSERNRALSVGMSDYIVKPLTLEKCRSIFNKFLPIYI